MDCADAKLRMEPCASGALVPEELALFEEHIAACEGCRLELELVRAVGKTGVEESAPKSDDWTLDRIFGGETPKGPAPPSADAEPLPIAPLTAGADQPAAPTPVEADRTDAASIFETTPNPLPPEASPPARAAEPSDAVGRADAAVSAESNAFDEPNPVSAAFDDAASVKAPAPATPAPATPAPATPAPAASAAPARASSAPAPAPDASDMGQSWDFEPADAKPEASLPEGSLFFAEETLARQGSAGKKKNTAKRMVLWGAGALVGVALLGIALWVGLSVREDGSSIKAQLSPGNPTTPPAAPDAAPESLVAAPEEGSTGTSGATTPDVVTQPADEAIANPPAKALGARALSGGGVPPIPTSTRSGSQPVAPRSMTGAPAAAPSARGSKGEAATPGGGTPRRAATSPEATTKPAAGAASRPTETRPAAPELDPEQLELLAPPPTPPPTPEQNVPFTGVAKGADGSQTASPRSTAPTVAPSASADPAPAAPPADQVQRPIDRLHLATVNAEQGSDLVALRKLRDTWKGFVRTSVGPDRARAKRELADCLWGIQSLTGKASDKREALAAYREYLLNAPAGGADPRTVARMRQLEDALAESK